MNKIQSLSLILISCSVGFMLTAVTSAAGAKEPSRPYGIRYTTGTITTTGWEKSLCQNDPNLKHWNWAAVTTNTQGYRRIAPGSLLQQNKRPSGSIYIKPIQVSPMINAKPRENHAPIMVGARSTADLQGRINLPKQNNASSSAEGTKVLTYNYHFARDKNLSADKLSDSKDVHGRLLKSVN